MKRSLSLRREALAELSVTDLTAVAGAVAASGASCPVADCLDWSRLLGTCNCWSSTCA